MNFERRTWSFRFEKYAWVLGVVFAYSCYYILNPLIGHLQTSSPSIFFDHWIPLRSEWMFFYAMVFLVACWPLAVVRFPPLFRRTCVAYIVTTGISLTVFVLFPTFIELRPKVVEVKSFFDWALKIAYFLDYPHNCFPSMHVSISVLSALCIGKADRMIGRIVMVCAWMICLSTMFVKQHFVVDVISGILLAYGIYYWLVIGLATESVETKKLRLPRKLSILAWCLFLLVVLVFFFSYKLGWEPYPKDFLK